MNKKIYYFFLVIAVLMLLFGLFNWQINGAGSPEKIPKLTDTNKNENSIGFYKVKISNSAKVNYQIEKTSSKSSVTTFYNYYIAKIEHSDLNLVIETVNPGTVEINKEYIIQKSSLQKLAQDYFEKSYPTKQLIYANISTESAYWNNQNPVINFSYVLFAILGVVYFRYLLRNLGNSVFNFTRSRLKKKKTPPDESNSPIAKY